MARRWLQVGCDHTQTHEEKARVSVQLMDVKYETDSKSAPRISAQIMRDANGDHGIIRPGHPRIMVTWSLQGSRIYWTEVIPPKPMSAAQRKAIDFAVLGMERIDGRDCIYHWTGQKCPLGRRCEMDHVRQRYAPPPRIPKTAPGTAAATATAAPQPATGNANSATVKQSAKSGDKHV